MEKSYNPFVFISIFYAQEKWHELLPVIRKALIHQPATPTYVFFSSHRGSSIRLALRYDDPDQKESFKKILDPILTFLKSHPPQPQPIQLPITGFFEHFSNNEIKYNLYNERVIAQRGLETFQLTLSKLLLVFFEDHPVDNEALFTLVVWLQDAVLNGLCDSRESKYLLIWVLLDEVERKEANFHFENIPSKHFEIHMRVPEINDEVDVGSCFNWIKNATHILFKKNGSVTETFFAIMQIVNLHLLKLSDEIFLDSLHYLAGSLQLDSTAQSSNKL